MSRGVGCLLACMVAWFVILPSLGQGFLLPEGHPNWRIPRPHPPWPPHPPFPPQPPRPVPTPQPPVLFRTKQVDIDARIIDSVARVQVSQTFVNDGSQTVEARCVMPLPYDAAVENLTFLVDGKEIEGKLLPADEARRIYQGYVQRSQDPALVQWIGTGLIQTNVFPIPPGKERTVSLSYTQVLRRANGMLDWQMPLKTAGYSSTPVEQVNIQVYVQSSEPIGNLYSPTHDVDISRSGNKQANVKYRSKSQVPTTNFRLMVASASSELAANWLAYRPEAKEPGYFLLLLHPALDAKVDESPKNIVLVLDKSGSMRGPKIDQARQALLYVLDHMPKRDRLGLVVYDSHVISFRDQLIDASNTEAMNQARSFVQSLGASGSTNIDQALDTALKMVAGSDRTSYIIHLSDGIPTVGERDEQRIVANATKANSRRSRIFNVGVGYDVNSKLINRLSAACFGQSFYVAPEENVEATVSALYDRLGQPALSDVRWSFVSDRTGDAGDVKLQSVYPFQLADLFSGDEASVAGRFEGTGRGKLVFTGKLSGKEVRYEQTIDLDQASPRADGSYVASIWASRRAAGIIDEIDLEGRKDSLIKELVELARKYGILTEYTAFLAEEPMGPQSLARGAELAEERLGRLSLEAGQDAFRQRSSNMKMSQSKNIAQAQEQQLRALGQSYDGAGFNAGGTGGFGGSPPAAAPAANLPGQPADAVKSSILGTTVTRTEGRMAGGPLQSPVRQAGDRAFFLRAGQWVDSRIQGDVPKTAKKIPRFSDEYFAILEKHHDLLATMLDAEEPIVVELDNQVYIL